MSSSVSASSFSATGAALTPVIVISTVASAVMPFAVGDRVGEGVGFRLAYSQVLELAIGVVLVAAVGHDSQGCPGGERDELADRGFFAVDGDHRQHVADVHVGVVGQQARGGHR